MNSSLPACCSLSTHRDRTLHQNERRKVCEQTEVEFTKEIEHFNTPSLFLACIHLHDDEQKKILVEICSSSAFAETENSHLPPRHGRCRVLDFAGTEAEARQ